MAEHGAFTASGKPKRDWSRRPRTSEVSPGESIFGFRECPNSYGLAVVLVLVRGELAFARWMHRPALMVASIMHSGASS
jgi:hypothetical protein